MRLYVSKHKGNSPMDDQVEHLVVAGAQVNAKDKLGYTPMHRAAEGQWGVTGWEGTGGREVTLIPLVFIFYSCLQTRHEDVVRLLLQSGADPTIKDLFGRTSLDIAADKVGVRQLIQAALVSTMKQRNQTVEGTRSLTESPSSATSLSTAAAAAAAVSAVKIEDWDRTAVGQWLQKIGLPQYETVFSEKGINGTHFLVSLLTIS